MKARCDDQLITLTDEYIMSLIQLMKAECRMMRLNGRDPDMWVWGRCYIIDLGLSSGGLEFSFGSREDFPNDGEGDFAVISRRQKIGE